MASYVGLKVEIYKKALEGPNVQKFHSRRVLRTILKKIVFGNVFLKAINAFYLRIFAAGGIWDEMEIFTFFSLFHGWVSRDCDGSYAAHEQADGKSEVITFIVTY